MGNLAGKVARAVEEYAWANRQHREYQPAQDDLPIVFVNELVGRAVELHEQQEYAAGYLAQLAPLTVFDWAALSGLHRARQRTEEAQTAADKTAAQANALAQKLRG